MSSNAIQLSGCQEAGLCVGPGGSCGVASTSLGEAGAVTNEAVEFVVTGGGVTWVESVPKGESLPTAEEVAGNSVPEEEEGTK